MAVRVNVKKTMKTLILFSKHLLDSKGKESRVENKFVKTKVGKCQTQLNKKLDWVLVALYRSRRRV